MQLETTDFTLFLMSSLRWASHSMHSETTASTSARVSYILLKNFSVGVLVVLLREVFRLGRAEFVSWLLFNRRVLPFYLFENVVSKRYTLLIKLLLLSCQWGRITKLN